MADVLAESIGPQAATPAESVASVAPFEGPEKLLEIWFAPSLDHVPEPKTEDGRRGLRAVKREVWEEMLEIVKCKVLSYVEGAEIDAYLLSESSLFISPHKLILKTCGTTLNLYGIPRILEIAAEQCGFHKVHRCFYSRKSFMFPERQLGPHRDWREEVKFLDSHFKNGAAYTIGKVNGDHWLLWLSSEEETEEEAAQPPSGSTPTEVADYTIEILMSKLATPAREAFFYPAEPLTSGTTPQTHALELSKTVGIGSLFPPDRTQLDAYAFEPCGYSANALISWGEDEGKNGEGYWTIHVTPEEGWSFASFECNVPVPATPSSSPDKNGLPDLSTLIQRVLQTFQPGSLTLTLFISSSANNTENAPIETAQKVFRETLLSSGYKRTDKINYVFRGYDLAFASFEKVDPAARRR